MSPQHSRLRFPRLHPWSLHRFAAQVTKIEPNPKDGFERKQHLALTHNSITRREVALVPVSRAFPLETIARKLFCPRTHQHELTFKLQRTANEYAAKRRIYKRPDQQKYTLSRHAEFCKTDRTT